MALEVFDSARFLPEAIWNRVTEVRTSDPDRSLATAKARERREQLASDGKLNILAAVSPDGTKMNWGRATGEGFAGIRTHIMDVSSLNLGPENAVPYDPDWGEPMPAE